MFETIVINFLPFIALPIALWILYSARWHYVRRKLVYETDWRLYEIIVPKEVFKTPKAMETIFTTLNQTYQGNWWLRISQGKFRTWFSFEIASFEGDVHIYMFMDVFHSQHVKAQFYSQYPDVMLREVDDYTSRTPKPYKGDWNMLGLELKFNQPNPYPIKTYVDWNLDKDAGKEETRVDPMAPMIEYMSNLGPKEYCYVQILVQPVKKHKRRGIGGMISGFAKLEWVNPLEEYGFEEEAQDEVEKIKNAGTRMVKTEKGEVPMLTFRTPGEEEKLKAVERKIGQIMYDVGIRCMYFAHKDVYNKWNQHGMTRMFDPYTGYNGFGLGYYSGFDFPWQDPTGSLTKFKQKKMFQYYQLRSFFYPPYRKTFGLYSEQSPHLVLSEEELATIFHVPSNMVLSAGLTRVESKKVEAPSNLPG